MAFTIAKCTSAALLSVSFAASTYATDAPRYSWMLPKTVIDTTIVYTFVSCEQMKDGRDKLMIKITPTLAPRSVPDLAVGRMGISPDPLESFWQDRNISVTTFPITHILSEIGSSPTDQTAQIVGNVLTGVTKLAGIAFGVPGAAASNAEIENKGAGPGGVPLAPVKSNCGSANQVVQDIKSKTDQIKDLQVALAGGVDDATFKKDSDLIQALQTVVAREQGTLSLTVKGTIDPGYGFSSADSDAGPHKNPEVLDKTGLVATILPSVDEVKKTNWFLDANAGVKNSPLLAINVYLDFENGYVPNGAATHPQTKISNSDLGPDGSYVAYRDVAYLLVHAWQGEEGGKPDPADGTLVAKELGSPVIMAFAQYGTVQSLPVTADAFKQLVWDVSFQDNGEVTKASFSSKSIGNTVTNLFGSAASAADSIYAAQQKAAQANSPSNQAAALQAQADLIYEGQRLSLCQAEPSSCPSK